MEENLNLQTIVEILHKDKKNKTIRTEIIMNGKTVGCIFT